MNIEIDYSTKRVLDSIENNTQINVYIILFIVYYSVKLNRRIESIDLDYIVFVFNMVRLNKKIEKQNVTLSKPWHIDDNIRKYIILAISNKLIRIEINTKNKSDIKYIVDENGQLIIETIEKNNLFIEIISLIKDIVVNVSKSDLQKQNLIW